MAVILEGTSTFNHMKKKEKSFLFFLNKIVEGIVPISFGNILLKENSVTKMSDGELFTLSWSLEGC